MSFLPNSVVTPGTGFLFVAAPGTAIPTQTEIQAYVPGGELDTAVGDWNSIGHTSRDELPSFGFDGGDTEVQGTWQNASFREVVTEAPADYVTFQAHQFDDQVLSFYYGTEIDAVSGVLSVANASISTVARSFLLIIIDGPRRPYFHAAEVSLRREDSISMETDSFAAFPLRATFIKNGTNPLYSWGGVAVGLPA